MYDKHYDDDEIHRLKQTIKKVLPSKDERKKLKRSLTKIRDTTVKTSVVHILKMLDSICNVKSKRIHFKNSSRHFARPC